LAEIKQPSVAHIFPVLELWAVLRPPVSIDHFQHPRSDRGTNVTFRVHPKIAISFGMTSRNVSYERNKPALQLYGHNQQPAQMVSNLSHHRQRQRAFCPLRRLPSQIVKRVNNNQFMTV
jgi:hypothetical protein